MLKVIEYQQQHSVSFDLSGGELMVNATQMALPFGKKPNEFVRLRSTQEYLDALESVTGIPRNTLIQTFRGNSQKKPQGTWVHKLLAVRFAQWLSPHFAVWVDKQIEELLTKGKVELSLNRFDLMRSVIDAMEDNSQRIKKVEQRQAVIEAKVSNINEDYFSLSGYYVLRGRRFDLSNTEAQQTGKRLSKQSRLNGYTVNRTHHFDIIHRLKYGGFCGFGAQRMRQHGLLQM